MHAPHFGDSRPGTSNAQTSPADRWLLRAYDATLALSLFAAPLVLGGRHPLGRLVFVVLALAGAGCWCARQSLGRSRRWKPSWAEGLFGAALLLVALQLTPLPESLHALLVPAASEVLPLWTASSDSNIHLGNWTTISLAPYETRIGLLVFLAYAALFVTASARITSQADVEQVLRWIAWAAFGMAVLGIAQYLFGNGKFLWVYLHPFRDAASGVKGPFVNRNHFVHFLAVGIGPLLWMVYRELHRDRAQPKSRRSFAPRKHALERTSLYAAGGMLLVTLLAALLSFSRGGILTLAAVLATCLGLFVWKRLLDRQAILVIGAAAALLLASLAIHGMGQISARLESLTSLADDHSAHMRLTIWNAEWQAVKRFAPLGIGAGAHTEVYPLFLDSETRVEFTHAENGYLQVLAENGIAGLGLLLAGIGVAGCWCWRALAAKEPARLAAAAAVVASLAAPLVHGGIDFVWWIPACMTPTLLLLACLRYQAAAAAEKQPRRSDPVQGDSWRWAWGLGTAALAVVVLAAGSVLWGPARGSSAWEQYLAMSLATKHFRADAEDHGGSARWGKLDPESPDVIHAQARLLAESLRHDPDNPRTNARYAALRLRQFNLAQQASENPMSLAMIRDAALASKFASRQQQDQWLAAALGDNHLILRDALGAALAAVNGSPMQGEVYTQLAELSFLRSPRPEHTTALIDQAVRVRPHSGNVLLAAGREAAIGGEQERAMELLRSAFHSEREVQKLVIELIAPQTSPGEFLAAFQPDLEALRLLRSHFQQTERPAEALEITAHIAVMSSDEAQRLKGLPAARLWNEASRMHAELGDLPAAQFAARESVHAAPLDYDMREHFAYTLMATRHFAEAGKQWQWCLSRKPSNDHLRQQLAAAKQLSLTQGRPQVEQASRSQPYR